MGVRCVSGPAFFVLCKSMRHDGREGGQVGGFGEMGYGSIHDVCAIFGTEAMGKQVGIMI